MDNDFRFYLADKVFSLLAVGTKWGLSAYTVVTVTPYLAGRETHASFILSILGLDFSPRWPLLLTGAAVAWAILATWVMRWKTRTLTERIQFLEQRIDPNRTSSGLLQDGRTRPEDL